MESLPAIDRNDVRVFLASPEPYEECVVLAETMSTLLFTLTDEQRDGKCIVEVADDHGRMLWRIGLSDLRILLDQAEHKLTPVK